MKNNLLTFIYMIQTLVLVGQGESTYDLLETDSSWQQEIFHFPIHFAPEIKFEGYEDARFPQHWSKKDSMDFWSYVFVWSIDNPLQVTTGVLESNIETYFNGLMKYDNSTAVFLKQESKDSTTQYTGKVKTFDALIAKKKMTLNIVTEYYYCKSTKKTYIVFKLSPSEFVDDIWDKLRSVQLMEDYCNR